MKSIRHVSVSSKDIFPYVMLFPAVVGLILFSLYPLVSGIWYSFTDIGWVGGKFRTMVRAFIEMLE